MHDHRGNPSSSEVAMGVAGVSAALGILTMVLFPFAVGGLLLFVIAPVAVLVAPLVLLLLLVAPLILLLRLARRLMAKRGPRLLRVARRRRRPALT
jgi:hypothetical protein